MITKTNVTNSPTLISAARDRHWACISNLSDETVYVALDGTAMVTASAGASPGVPIAPGASLMFDHFGAATNFDNAFYAIHAGSGNKVVVVQET